jgi:uncharacterized protein (DUF433 family)
MSAEISSLFPGLTEEEISAVLSAAAELSERRAA